MSKKVNQYVSFILFLAIIGTWLYRQKNNQEFLRTATPSPMATASPTAVPAAQLEFVVGSENYKFVATVSGQNALDLVQSQVKLNLKKYDFGLMVEGVNDLMADNQHYWAVYQNNDYAKTGLAEIKLEKDETIELRYEEIKL